MVINFTNLPKTLDKIIEAGWLLIFGLSPIFFCPWVYGTWQIGEYFLFQVLTEIILFVWLAKIIFESRTNAANSQRESVLSQRKSVMFRILPAIIFIVILGLATIFSKSPYHSFWGYYQRKMGYIIWLHFFAFFSILFFNLKDKKQIIRIFYAIIGSSVVVVVYGFLQIFGLDPFPWSESPFFNSRIFSTLGQPNFLASWLLLIIPIIFWALFKVARHWTSKNNFFNRIFKRPLIACLLFGTIISLVLTQSRSGWIGFFIAFFFFIIIWAYFKKQKRLSLLLLILLAVIILFVIYLNFNPIAPQKGDSFLIARLKTLTNFNETGKLRLIWWGNSLDLIKQAPIFGYGPEIQRFLFIPYYQPDFAVLEAINSYPDRAHNDILDTLLIGGILGLISYLFLIISAFCLGLKSVFKSKLEILVLLTGLIGYLVSIQFSFHVIPTAVYFWGYLAIVLKISLLPEEANNDYANQ
ncbi:MAG: O-antigen ligase family protein [Patescibacteria group bacterium]|jgi:putative inorganic carbon (HCO3(-)) transporter